MQKKILCYINHYYKKAPGSIYKSGSSNDTNRLSVVNDCVNSLKDLSEISDIDIKICGIHGCSLIGIDIDFSYLDNPQLLVYESLKTQISHKDDYDYIINCEDDILFNKEVLLNTFEFDKVTLTNEVFLPNRVEIDNKNNKYCVDLIDPSWDIWTFQRKIFNGHDLRVALNPHSGVLILSKKKLDYLIKHVEVNKFEKLLHGNMASAYAFFHTPFSLYRSFNDLDFHYVRHLDQWQYSAHYLRIKKQVKRSSFLHFASKIMRKAIATIKY